jgi:hypothetical protein
MGRGGHLGLTQVNVRIKMIIIIVLKLDLRVNSGKGQGHGSQVNLGQCKNKSCYHIFKIQLGGRLGQCPSHGSGGSTQLIHFF